MVGGLIAAVVAALLCMLAIRVGPVLGFVDIPDGSALKAHDRPAVPLGGVGVFAGVHIGMATAGIFDPGLLAASGLVFVLGVVDDRIQLPPRVRLAVEVAAGIVLAIAADFPSDLDAVEIGVVVVLVVGAINAVNLFDGLDGLVGSSGLLAGLGLAALAALRSLDVAYGLILAGALAGFLVFNWHKARVFLGDNGAYSVGVFLVYGMVVVSAGVLDVELLVTLGVLGVFALDLVGTILRRRLAGAPLFLGDRSHLYDQLNDRGRTVPAVTLTMAAVQVGFLAVMLAVDAFSSPWLVAAVWVVVALVALAIMRSRGFLETAALPDV